VEDGSTFFLEGAELERQVGSADVHAAAQPLVKRMNGIAKLRSSSFRDVELGAGVRELDEQGEQRRHVVLAVGTVEPRRVRASIDTPMRNEKRRIEPLDRVQEHEGTATVSSEMSGAQY
jgi:hypothetical protein